MAAHGAGVVQPAWAAFATFMAVAGGVGYLFLGLSMVAAGFGGASTKALPPALAWLTMAGGAATVIIILAEATPLEAATRDPAQHEIQQHRSYTFQVHRRVEEPSCAPRIE